MWHVNFFLLVCKILAKFSTLGTGKWYNLDKISLRLSLEQNLRSKSPGRKQRKCSNAIPKPRPQAKQLPNKLRFLDKFWRFD